MLQERQTALFVKLEIPIPEAGFELKGSIPTAIAVDNYFDIIELGDGLHSGVVETCRRVRDRSLDNWGSDMPAGQHRL
ncbi:hypothetical protein [Mycobacterium colombiense]|uniref:hypothetical protein n=1 Tax=Mycobacterium colombiense TaxID=339268 RepID=UPI0011E4CE91|nr:hypothetical protein [Mycobacterium colombiense]